LQHVTTWYYFHIQTLLMFHNSHAAITLVDYGGIEPSSARRQAQLRPITHTPTLRALSPNLVGRLVYVWWTLRESNPP